MNYTGPKVKLSRKLGIALTPKARKYMDNKPYPPGVHGPKTGRRRISDYKRQLLEKQKLKFQYNVSERQMINFFKQAIKSRGNPQDVLVQLLECRFDALVLRAGFARTIYAARQLVTHGHFQINGKKVNFPGYMLKVGDTINIKEKSRKLECIHNAIKYSKPPSYIEVSKPDLSFRYIREPDREEIPVTCDSKSIVEYYSR